jgi:O-antigen/teichoic acid export membrane protein
MSPVPEETARASREAAEATRGSAVKLAAEVASRLLGVATTVLLLRGLPPAELGAFGALSVYALLLAELGELGLQALAPRALVAGTHSLESLVRARLALSLGVAVLAAGLAAAGPALAERLGPAWPDGPALALLVAWFALSGWAEFEGVALRCRGARRLEALVLVVLRGAALAGVALALAAGSGLRGVSVALALSALPAVALGAFFLRRTPAPSPGPAVAPLCVLRDSAPLAAHGALLLLSPRVEFLVLSWLGDPRSAGLFYAALNVLWFLSMAPAAIAAGAMPSLTREALHGGGAVRRRTAATLALLAAPAAVGLALVAPPLAVALLGAKGARADHEAVARLLLVLSAAVPAAFVNALLLAALIARGRAPWLPRLTAARVALALALSLALVPALGAPGASAGLVVAEWLLLGAAWLACREAAFPVAPGGPLAAGLLACVPMALVVSGMRQSLPLAVATGALTWAATLAALWRLRPGLARGVAGGLLKYP